MAAWALLPRISNAASRRSNDTDSLNRSINSAGPAEKRPPQVAWEDFAIMVSAEDYPVLAATRKSGCSDPTLSQVRRMFYRSRWLAGCLTVASALLAADPTPPASATPVGNIEAAPALSPRYRRVEVAPTKTSIYIGTVALTLPPLERHQNEYTTTYEATVFPFFFYNETGRLRIECSDEQLRRLERGERVAFQGRAQRANGSEHRVEGTVTPTDATSGKVKVRVFATMSVELIFNTTYHFTGQ